MNKLTLLLACMLTLFSVHADNYFTVGENGILRISPGTINGGNKIVTVKMHLEGRIDSWSVTINYPSAFAPSSFEPSVDVTSIPYTKSDGSDSTYHAMVMNMGYIGFSSTISEFGYWDFDHNGTYEPYGTIKWEAGDHDHMFDINFAIMGDCNGDSICLTGTMSSTYDWRGGTTGGNCYRCVHIKVGYKLGDVNGDENVNITDVNELIRVVQNSIELDNYHAEAADINGDGQINITDVNLLIAIINYTDGLSGMDDYDDPVASILGNSGTLPF